jgi:dihydroflavonol-4-reductase
VTTSLLTGGTGFVGAHVARALVRRGDRVRCLVRAGSRLDNLEGLDVERVVGDLRDPESLQHAAEGCDEIYHCAADYRLWAPDPAQIYENNVQGTCNVLEAAACVGARVVHTSSVGALGLHPDGTPADETTPVTVDDMIGHYKRSKFLAEREAEKAATAGQPVIIVNPSTPIGDLDIKPTPTGQVIVDFLNRRVPAYVETGLNLVDVHDVARGHLLAAERGKPGEKYILGHRNLSLKQIFDLLSGITGLPSPRLKLPHAVPLAAAHVSELWARLRGKPPRISPESVRMSMKQMYFDASKAVRELGLPQSPVEDALERAVRWFTDHGYVVR